QLDTVNDIYNHANVLRGISNVYLEQKEPFKALPFATKAFKKYTDNNFNDDRFHAMPELIEIYKATNRSTEAVALYDEYFTVKDSILSSEQDKNIADAIQKYETEKKDAQLKVLALESEKAEQQKRVFLYLFLIGLFVTALIGFFLYKNRKKNKLLAKQKSLLESTVDEKNILLRETHHRVKNSFQMVSSLLYIQSETVKNKEAQLAIKEAQNRVRSMVLIHQKLYSKDQLVGIDAKEYIEDFTKDIMDSYQFETEKLNYVVSAESLVLDIETITPMGLILNELVTNVLKHAFDQITNESVMNIIFKEEDNELILSVIDNGKGMPESIKEESFGIELIKALTQKLKATLNIKSNDSSGTNATVTMKRYTIL
ncbi:MAG: sensor histidine kinase, partial [Flavobacteriaceae bacterium]|nr:sensor histidine kinase [Flavobacteriaceae bacterium]